MFCKKCGSENPDGAKFCRKCGASLAAGESSGTQGQQNYGGTSGTQGQQNYGGTSGTQSQQNYSGQQTPPPYTPPYQHKMTIDDLPQEYRPIGMWGYFGYSLLFNIPFAGWIIALVFAFGVTSNVNLKNYARGYFCGLIVVLALLFLLSMGGCSLLAMM